MYIVLNTLGSALFVISVAALMMLNWRLIMKVIRQRRKNEIAIGLKGHEMERVASAHRNFVENVPINLIAPSLVFVMGFGLIAWIPAALLLAGRLFHANGIQDPKEHQTGFKNRALGMKLTFASTIAGVVVLVIATVARGF